MIFVQVSTSNRNVHCHVSCGESFSQFAVNVITEDDARVTLLVHQVKPPFLDGRVSFSDIREAVPTVRDSSSDFAKMAREGSATLRHLRENKEKHTMRQKFWELGGTRMGQAVGVKEEKPAGGEKDGAEEVQATENADGVRLPMMLRCHIFLCLACSDDADAIHPSQEIDYRKSTGFAAHVKNKKKDEGAVSEFAKKKSIRQQREYLPVFSVRDELLNVVRENAVVIIVG